ncbi:Post-GPI attachment to proteins factor 6 [Lamellibrachia satsuma]|nr:Post-GPI attachment to proteins factor 6 [Lamellibrachia satsuma]
MDHGLPLVNGPRITIVVNGPRITTVINGPRITTVVNGPGITTVVNGPRVTTIVNGPRITTGGETTSIYFKHSPIQLFNDYSDVRVQTFTVPPHSIVSIWTFNAFSEKTNCRLRKATIYLQHGTYPLVNPFDEILPDNYYIERTDMVNFDVPTNNISIIYKNTWPRQGAWFAVIYLSDRSPEDDRISLKTMKKVDCVYEISSAHQTHFLDRVDTLCEGQPMSVSAGNPLLRQFHIAAHAWQFELRVDSCGIEGSAGNSTCPLLLYARALQLPALSATLDHFVNCSLLPPDHCVLTVFQPAAGKFYYMAAETLMNATVTFTVSHQSHECVLFDPVDLDANATRFGGDCHRLPTLDRLTDDYFSSIFLFLGGYINIFLHDREPIVMATTLSGRGDRGGTFMVRVIMNSTEMIKLPQKASVEVCVQRLSVPVVPGDVACTRQHFIHVNSSARQLENALFVPYPEPGVWYISTIVRCYNTTTLTREPCIHLVPVLFHVKVVPCIEGECNDNGLCWHVVRDLFPLSVCKCWAGYRGYSCLDDREADSDLSQFVEVLLLTLSNLAFLPAVGVALYKQCHCAAVIYAFTMFFSTFYHACDVASKYTYCIFDYDVLAHGDFFGSIFSVSVTLLDMAILTPHCRALMLTSIGLVLTTGVRWDRTNIFVFLGPTLLTLTALLATWGFGCHERHACYPSRRRWLYFLLPGMSLALVAVVMYALFETTTNYRYIHSAWHVCIALCTTLLLPSRSHYAIEVTGERTSVDSIQLCRKSLSRLRDHWKKGEVNRKENNSFAMDSNCVTTVSEHEDKDCSVRNVNGPSSGDHTTISPVTSNTTVASINDKELPELQL